MAILKCKMCGGDLEVQEGMSVIECDYCGTAQTVSTVKDENLQGLYNRANLLRMKSEFDKAEAIYEKILQVKEDEAEAHWGVVLCQYGIEYVEDPQTFKRIPTCHRASYEAIVANVDYQAAITYADAVQKAVYEKEAQMIDEIQKGILAISQKEEPYDVFICYKETDANGQRTIDSAIANDIYYQLTQEGFKVFYAAITLEEKLGSEYEASIFSALNSAKVMLSIGTKPEYFSAVWVKNEWSRFLKIMKKDRSKMLIPCYRDMDAYELPEEFAHLQAQDMSKIGFINDLVRGIKKVIPKDGGTIYEASPVGSGVSTNLDPLLERAFMFLEDRDWASADEYCEKVLDNDPKNARAYLGKLMVEYQIDREENIRQATKPLEQSNQYQKILRFGSPELVKSIEEDNEFIMNRNKEKIYVTAKSSMDVADSEQSFIELSHVFEKISEYKDASELIQKCLELAEIERKKVVYNRANALIEKNTVAAFEEAKEIFATISDFEDAQERIKECDVLIKDKTYSEAIFGVSMANINSLKWAIKKLETIIDWKDAKEQIVKFSEAKEQLEIKIKQYNEDMMKVEKELAELQNARRGYINKFSKLGMFSGKERVRLESELQVIADRIAGLESRKQELILNKKRIDNYMK